MNRCLKPVVAHFGSWRWCKSVTTSSRKDPKAFLQGIGFPNIPSAVRVADSSERNSPYDKPRVLHINRVSDLAGGRGIDALPAQWKCRNNAAYGK